MNKENIDKQEKSMFIPDTYIPALIQQLKRVCSDQLICVGLQGSYLRGDATENSDIDIMVII